MINSAKNFEALKYDHNMTVKFLCAHCMIQCSPQEHTFDYSDDDDDEVCRHDRMPVAIHIMWNHSLIHGVISLSIHWLSWEALDI